MIYPLRNLAFVVLLGTVFPLLADAIQHRSVKVGAPYFDRLTGPLGLCLLTLMAIAPVLPWRKASGELLSQRLLWPAWSAVAAVARRAWQEAVIHVADRSWRVYISPSAQASSASDKARKPTHGSVCAAPPAACHCTCICSRYR